MTIFFFLNENFYLLSFLFEFCDGSYKEKHGKGRNIWFSLIFLFRLCETLTVSET